MTDPDPPDPQPTDLEEATSEDDDLEPVFGPVAGVALTLAATVGLAAGYGALQYWVDGNGNMVMLAAVTSVVVWIVFGVCFALAELPPGAALLGIVYAGVFAYVQWGVYALLDGASAEVLSPDALWAFIQHKLVDPDYPDWRMRSAEDAPGSVPSGLRGAMWAAEAGLYSLILVGRFLIRDIDLSDDDEPAGDEPDE